MSTEPLKIEVSKCNVDLSFKCGPTTNGKISVCKTNNYCNQNTWQCQGIPTKSIYRECINDMDRFCITPVNCQKTLGRL